MNSFRRRGAPGASPGRASAAQARYWSQNQSVLQPVGVESLVFLPQQRQRDALASQLASQLAVHFTPGRQRTRRAARRRRRRQPPLKAGVVSGTGELIPAILARRVVVPAALRLYVDAGVEHREVETAIAIEVVRARDRGTCPDRREHLRWRQPEPSITGPEEHLYRQLVQPVFDRFAPVVGLTAGDDVVAAVPVEVRYGDDDLDPVEAALRLNAREPLRVNGAGEPAGDEDSLQTSRTPEAPTTSPPRAPPAPDGFASHQITMRQATITLRTTCATPRSSFAGGRTPKAQSQSTPRGGISGVVSCVATCAAKPEPAFS